MKRGFLKNRTLSPPPSASGTSTRPSETAPRATSAATKTSRVPPKPAAIDPGPQMMQVEMPSNAVMLEAMEAFEAQGIRSRLMVPSPPSGQTDEQNPDAENELKIVTVKIGHPSSYILIVTRSPNRARLRAHPFFNAFPPFPNAAAAGLLTIKDVPGKGKSLFARRAFAKGDAVLVEHPLLTVAYPIPMSISAYFDKLLAEMRPEVLRAYKALYNCKEVGDLPGKSADFGRMRTNGFFAEFPYGEAVSEDVKTHSVTYDWMSRANHSCEANAQHQFGYDVFAGFLMATQTIKAGEEITVSYLEDSQPLRVRQAELKKKYGFDCRCTLCVREGAEN